MHVFDELLNSRKLSASNSPTYFTPLLMQDEEVLPQPIPITEDCAPHTEATGYDKRFLHDRPCGITNNSGGGPAVQNDFHTLPDDAEGSDQEQDMTYDGDTVQNTADGGTQEATNLPLPPSRLPTPPSPTLLMRNKGDVLQYFRTALTVSTAKQSGGDAVIAMLEERKASTEVMSSANISVRDALRTKGGEAKRVILKELKQMIDRKVFSPVCRSLHTEHDRRSTIRSPMFLKAKYHPDGTFDKLKAHLVAGGDQQDSRYITTSPPPLYSPAQCLP
jgi:hypothetical protein